MTERYFYTAEGSIQDNLVHTLEDAFKILQGAISDISNHDHLKISIQGPNGEEVIKV